MPPPEWVYSLPSANATLNAAATVLLLVGYWLVHRGKIDAHKRVMISAFAVSIAFLCSYLTYHAYAGSKRFEGEGLVLRPVYFAILITHVILAASVPVLAPITIYFGLKQRWDKHRRIARVTYPIWLYVSVTGVIIYFMLYHWTQVG